ncbi:MAG: hypothetical protein FJW27_00630 [Acidimicrobiia bacterium]|nr:hypothetical protein [Acidimicrobiia bacterium]
MRALLVGPILGACLLLQGSAASAHHAFSSEFDASKPIILKGKVVKTEWVNPHSWVHIEVVTDGKTETWAIECGAPNALLRRGWTKASLPIGSEIVVDGYRAKNGSPTANAKDITTTEGKKMFVGSSGIGAPYEKQESK